jgi:glycosyl transferase, family 25
LKSRSDSIAGQSPITRKAFRVPPVFSPFERIRIVNLASRPDRRAEMEGQLASVGLAGDPRVEFFEALSFDDPGPFLRKGSRGAFMSHLALLAEAAAAGQSILILQDDCDFLVPEIDDFVMPECWDVFYGGYTASDPLNPAESDIIGAHFMGFSPRAAGAARRYLTEYLGRDFKPDQRAAAEPDFDPDIRPPIDGAFVWFRRAHPELRTVFAMLGVQRSSRTDIGDQRWFDKVAGLRNLAGLLRRLLRRRSAS